MFDAARRLPRGFSLLTLFSTSFVKPQCDEFKSLSALDFNRTGGTITTQKEEKPVVKYEKYRQLHGRRKWTETRAQAYEQFV